MYEYLERFHQRVEIASSLALDHVTFTSGETHLESLPSCPGVYRFYAADGALLYIGKSIDINSRVRSHFSDARNSQRERRIMKGVTRVDCQLTAGELGALLIENRSIKSERPLYNRRQRRLRTMWTVRLGERRGYLQPEILQFPPAGQRNFDAFGLYTSRQTAQRSLEYMARDEQLCLQTLGLKKSQGPCFQYQLNRCQGACVGEESPESHDGRLLGALAPQRIVAWPHNAPIFIQESVVGDQHQLQPLKQVHLIDDWVYLGSYANTDSLTFAGAQSPKPAFDRDAYRILQRSLKRMDLKCYCSATGADLTTGFQASEECLA